MACPATPQTGLGFDWGTKCARCRPHGNLFKQACSRYATRHQTFLERFLARHRTSLKLRWEDPFLGHGTWLTDKTYQARSMSYVYIGPMEGRRVHPDACHRASMVPQALSSLRRNHGEHTLSV